MVGDARTIEQLDTTRVLLSKRSTSPIAQQPFSSRLCHSLTPNLAPPFAGAWFLASGRCWEAPYQDRAPWHITQTAYLCRCLWLLACGELRRTLLRCTRVNKGKKRKGRGCLETPARSGTWLYVRLLLLEPRAPKTAPA